MVARVTITGIDDFLATLRASDELREVATIRAINDTARRAAALGKKEIQHQVAFKKSYLDDNLAVTKLAKPGSMTAVVTGRQQATSLARFVTNSPGFGGTRRGAAQPRVTVKPGRPIAFPTAFLIRLRRGKSLTGDSFNVGLAVRLKEGERLKSKYKYVPFGGGLYLLYGPSVDQVFNTVREDITPETTLFLRTEFVRQLEILTKNGR